MCVCVCDMHCESIACYTQTHTHSAELVQSKLEHKKTKKAETSGIMYKCTLQPPECSVTLLFVHQKQMGQTVAITNRIYYIYPWIWTVDPTDCMGFQL